MIRLRLVAVPLAALAFAGCGGDDKPSLDSYAQDAEKICSEGQDKIEKLERPQNLDEASKFVDDLEGTLQDTANRIDNLETPEGADGEKAEQFAQAFKTDIESQFTPKLDEMKQAAESGNEREFVAAADAVDDIETPRTDKLAKDIGAEGCAE